MRFKVWLIMPTADAEPNVDPGGSGLHGALRRAAGHWRAAIILLTVLLAAILLFARLGHYALWDDEATTALIGQGVWRTGDTSVVVGRNIVAYRNGRELSDHLKDRYVPPLQYYLAAPFVGPWPGSALAARFPFALVGLGAVILLLVWMYRDRADPLTWVLMTMGLVGNVSFWLYCRQCRYYALAIFLSLAIVYLYLHWTRRRWQPPLIAAASVGLFASNYLNYAALYGALGIDWLIWGRKRFRPDWRGWLWICLPQIILGGLIIWVWNPLGKPPFMADSSNGVWNRLTLLWWSWRDMNRCEFGAIVLVIAAPLLWFLRRDERLLRAPLALLCYVLAVVALSPQQTWVLQSGKWVQASPAADVRYFAPVILLLVGIGALAIRAATPLRLYWPAILLGVATFLTNAPRGGALAMDQLSQSPWPVQSTLLQFAGELLSPPPDPYSAAAAWINAHVAQDESVCTLPVYARYPLMFHAPKAVYGWQLDAAAPPALQSLPKIQFKERVPPDYFIIFGRATSPARVFRLRSGTHYSMVADLNVYGMDLYRPELLFRVFAPVPRFDPMVDGVRIYRRD